MFIVVSLKTGFSRKYPYKNIIKSLPIILYKLTKDKTTTTIIVVVVLSHTLGN